MMEEPEMKYLPKLTAIALTVVNSAHSPDENVSTGVTPDETT